MTEELKGPAMESSRNDEVFNAIDKVFVEHDDHVIDSGMSSADKQLHKSNGVEFKPYVSGSETDSRRMTGAAILTAAERRGGVIDEASLDTRIGNPNNVEIRGYTGTGETRMPTGDRVESTPAVKSTLDAVSDDSVYH